MSSNENNFTQHLMLTKIGQVTDFAVEIYMRYLNFNVPF